MMWTMRAFVPLALIIGFIVASLAGMPAASAQPARAGMVMLGQPAGRANAQAEAHFKKVGITMIMVDTGRR